MSQYYTLYSHPQSFGFYITVLGLSASLGMRFRHQALRKARLHARSIQPDTEEEVSLPLH